MGSDEPAGTGILGSLRSADGEGMVRMEDRLDTGIDDLWGALTDPDRLAHWFGEVEGELSQGRVPCAHRPRRRAHRAGGGVRASAPPAVDDARSRSSAWPAGADCDRGPADCRGRSDQAGLGRGLTYLT